MPYVSIEFKGEVNTFDLREVSIRRLPLKDGHWSISKQGIRTFCEKCFIYVINGPVDKRFDAPITGIRIFENIQELKLFLNGEAPSEFCRLKSSVKEIDWPEAPADIANKSSLPMTHPQNDHEPVSDIL